MSANAPTPDDGPERSAAHAADRAWTLIELRRWKDAITEAQRALALNPQHFNGLYNLSVAQRRAGDAAAAEQTARALIGYFPNSASAYNILSRALKDQRRLTDAITASREAIRLNPNDADLWINLADVLILQKLYGEGIEACQKAIDLNPNAAMAHNNYAVGLEEMGHNAKADASYRKAMELDPLNPLFHSNLGWLMNKQKNYAEAARLFYSAVKLEPAYKEYQKNMDRALRKAYPITRWLTVAYIVLMLMPLAMMFVLTQVGYGQALEPFIILLVIWVVYASFFSAKVESKLHEQYLRRKLTELMD